MKGLVCRKAGSEVVVLRSGDRLRNPRRDNLNLALFDGISVPCPALCVLTLQRCGACDNLIMRRDIPIDLGILVHLEGHFPAA